MRGRFCLQDVDTCIHLTGTVCVQQCAAELQDVQECACRAAAAAAC
jgi:hypothetical protein